MFKVKPSMDIQPPEATSDAHAPPSVTAFPPNSQPSKLEQEDNGIPKKHDSPKERETPRKHETIVSIPPIFQTEEIKPAGNAIRPEQVYAFPPTPQQGDMRGRDTYSMYKRALTRDSPTALDRDRNQGPYFSGPGKEIGNPSWKRPLPHVLVAILSTFLFGYHLGVVNETLESISINLGFTGDNLAEGLVVSTSLGGAFLGSIFSGVVADEVGRRGSFQFCALPMLIGASMSAKANTLGGMLVGRFLVGAGMGLGPPVAASYVSEISPAYVRGTYGSSTQISTCLGLMAALLIGIPAKDIPGWWRFCFWVSTIPAALLAILMEFCAESPHWLYKRGRIAETEEEIEKLFGEAHVKSTMAEFLKSDKGDEKEAVKISELIYGRHSKVVFIGSALFALQQLSGINAVFFFSSTVFRKAGVPSDSGNICVGIVNILGSFSAMIMMDKLGRKVLLFWSFFGMAFSMGLQVMAASSIAPSFAVMYLSVGGMLLFVLSFSIGAGPIPALLLSEIFPGRIRAKAMALCMAVLWVINFFVGLLFLRLLEQLGAQLLYTIFATFSLIAVIFVKNIVVETKGKTLQEIEIALL